MPQLAHVKKILESAILAPSGDNCQPWSFQVIDNRIQLFNLPGKDISLFNYRQRASLVAHGAVLENIRIASAALGYAAEILLFPDAALPDLVATIALTPSEIREQPLSLCLAQRSTNRKRYDPSYRLTREQRMALLESAREVGAGELLLLEDVPQKGAVARVAGINDRVVFENRCLHDFLYRQIRWSAEEARKSGDGLDVDTLELAPLDALGFRLFKSWPLLEMLNRCGVAGIIGKNAEKQALSASALGCVVVKGKHDADFVSAGRIFERVWLEATLQGLSFQPMTGILFLMNQVEEGSVEKLSLAQVALIKDAQAQLAASFGVKEGSMALLFRLGRSAPPRSRSVRLPVEAVTTF